MRLSPHAPPPACPGDVLHPGQTCTGHAASFLPLAYLRALPVYVPVYVIPALLVHRQRLLLGPAVPALWRKVGAGILRSSLFLSLFCTLAWRGACAGFQAAGGVRGDVLALSCWTGGLAGLAEKKSRRMELAIYCVSRVGGLGGWVGLGLGGCFGGWVGGRRGIATGWWVEACSVGVACHRGAAAPCTAHHLHTPHAGTSCRLVANAWPPKPSTLPQCLCHGATSAGRGVAGSVHRGVGLGAARAAAPPAGRPALLPRLGLHHALLQRPPRPAALRLPEQVPRRVRVGGLVGGGEGGACGRGVPGEGRGRLEGEGDGGSGGLGAAQAGVSACMCGGRSALALVAGSGVGLAPCPEWTFPASPALLGAHPCRFDWVLGNTGFQDATIRHDPSNADLLLSLESSLEGQRGLQPALTLVRSVRSMAQLATLVGPANGSGRETPKTVEEEREEEERWPPQERPRSE